MGRSEVREALLFAVWMTIGMAITFYFIFEDISWYRLLLKSIVNFVIAIVISLGQQALARHFRNKQG